MEGRSAGGETEPSAAPAHSDVTWRSDVLGKPLDLQIRSSTRRSMRMPTCGLRNCREKDCPGVLGSYEKHSMRGSTRPSSQPEEMLSVRPCNRRGVLAIDTSLTASSQVAKHSTFGCSLQVPRHRKRHGWPSPTSSAA